MNSHEIKIPQSQTPLPFTGERYTSAISGQIHHEHFHRYLFALEYCRGLDVLDVASGEGYGTSLLGQVARTATGVDNNKETIEHATRSYANSSVSFKCADALRLPAGDKSLDVVVSFETLEHLRDQAAFLVELNRVLRPSGTLIISTPEVEAYNLAGGEPNPFHFHELSLKQFKGLLNVHFRHVQIYGQRPLVGSCLVPIEPALARAQSFFDRNTLDTYTSSAGFPLPIYLIAVASSRELPEPRCSLLNDKFHAASLLGRKSRRRKGWLRRFFGQA